uniref:Ground-like domain-containing protein n=1 Tax=Caenorhabditis tropicalis TaxID=1561998 RepID=A0A1I7UZ68_9PELO
MRVILLLFLIIDYLDGFPVVSEDSGAAIDKRVAINDPNDRGVLPNIDALFCNNKDLRQVVFSALQNISDPNTIAVDKIQSVIETALMPKFKSSGGTWLVSATSYHRVNGFVDDKATGMDTFCAVNDINLNLYVVIMKIDN